MIVALVISLRNRLRGKTRNKNIKREDTVGIVSTSLQLSSTAPRLSNLAALLFVDAG